MFQNWKKTAYIHSGCLSIIRPFFFFFFFFVMISDIMWRIEIFFFFGCSSLEKRINFLLNKSNMCRELLSVLGSNIVPGILFLRLFLFFIIIKIYKRDLRKMRINIDRREEFSLRYRIGYLCIYC